MRFRQAPAPCRSPAHIQREREETEIAMRTPKQTGSDLMGRIEHLVAAGIPKQHLLQLSADLMVAGRVARRIGASAGQLMDWCRDCLNDHPGAAEQLIVREHRWGFRATSSGLRRGRADKAAGFRGRPLFPPE